MITPPCPKCEWPHEVVENTTVSREGWYCGTCCRFFDVPATHPTSETDLILTVDPDHQAVEPHHPTAAELINELQKRVIEQDQLVESLKDERDTYLTQRNEVLKQSQGVSKWKKSHQKMVTERDEWKQTADELDQMVRELEQQQEGDTETELRRIIGKYIDEIKTLKSELQWFKDNEGNVPCG